MARNCFVCSVVRADGLKSLGIKIPEGKKVEKRSHAE